MVSENHQAKKQNEKRC